MTPLLMRTGGGVELWLCEMVNGAWSPVKGTGPCKLPPDWMRAVIAEADKHRTKCDDCVEDDAPRTTAEECLMVRPDFPNGVKYVMVQAEFARGLEREIASLRKTIGQKNV